jgi:hypothetical protein
MTHDRPSVPFDEFTTNPARFFNQVLRDHETVIIKKAEGELVALRPLAPPKLRRRKKTKADYAAFLASAGSWHDVDTEELIKHIYKSRSISTRPPVEL